MNTNAQSRYLYFDYMRIIATFLVVLAHVAIPIWACMDVNDSNWFTYTFFSAVNRWTPTLFFMISGALFCGRKMETSQIYKKYVLKMVVAYFVWSTLYAFINYRDRTQLIQDILSGHYHMWFIMVIGILYCLLPVTKWLVKSEKRISILLLVAFVTVSINEFLLTIARDAGLAESLGLKFLAFDIILTLNNNFVYRVIKQIIGFVACFVLGYFLNNHHLTAKKRLAFYILGLFGVILTIILTAWISAKLGVASNNYSQPLTFNNLFPAMAVFIFLKYKDFKNIRLNKIVNKLSKQGFGIYIVHPMILEGLQSKFDFFGGVLAHPMVLIPILASIVFVISNFVSSVISRVPVLKKYIV